MNQYEFGYFPRNKYKDLVFYVKTGEHSNMGLFEMEDTEENRAIMDALIPHPYQSERDCPVCGGGLMRHFWCIDRDCGWDSIKEVRELRQKAGE